ncbi:hypothetical protein [Sedimentibacter sp.]|uniref:hypothetical protein n=1 Tax=Sedimentibacter sp. TaxID=1960295 RepID=UPI00289B9EE0|nr:hypothetical protein [Sedimentibacter sp.]
MELYIITFKHGNYAVAVFNKLQGYGVRNIYLTQTPFSIKSECDLCIKAYGENTYNIVMKECMKVPVDNVFMEIKKDGKTMYKMLP